MPEHDVRRKSRRRVPHRSRWESVELDRSADVDHRSSDPRGPWLAAAILAAGIVAVVVRAVMTESVAKVEEPPVWMEMAPPVVHASEEAPPDLSDVPKDAVPAATEGSPRESDLPGQGNPEPVFGLDAVGESGSLAVASGSTLARDADPVVAVSAPPTSPTFTETVPASVRPVAPIYPPRAEELGLEALVVALVTTDTLGAVVDFRLEKSGGAAFDQAVRRAVLSTRFVTPRGPDGRSRAMAFRLPYAFHLP